MPPSYPSDLEPFAVYGKLTNRGIRKIFFLNFCIRQSPSRNKRTSFPLGRVSFGTGRQLTSEFRVQSFLLSSTDRLRYMHDMRHAPLLPFRSRALCCLWKADEQGYPQNFFLKFLYTSIPFPQ